MSCSFSYGPQRDAYEMKNSFRTRRPPQSNSQFPTYIRVNRVSSSFYLCGDGENHLLDLLLRKSSAIIEAKLPIDLLVVRNGPLVIAQVMESSYRIQGARGVGIFHPMGRESITGASLYFALQKDIFPELRHINPPPVPPRLVSLLGHNKSFFS